MKCIYVATAPPTGRKLERQLSGAARNKGPASRLLPRFSKLYSQEPSQKETRGLYWRAAKLGNAYAPPQGSEASIPLMQTAGLR